MAYDGTLAKYQGHQYFRQRLTLSILSGKPVRIDRIRSDDKDPGLRGRSFIEALIFHVYLFFLSDFEISMLRLLEKVTNGTVIEISYTGEFFIKILFLSVNTFFFQELLYS